LGRADRVRLFLVTEEPTHKKKGKDLVIHRKRNLHV
jgi:hypothetical protein